MAFLNYLLSLFNKTANDRKPVERVTGVSPFSLVSRLFFSLIILSSSVLLTACNPGIEWFTCPNGVRVQNFHLCDFERIEGALNESR